MLLVTAVFLSVAIAYFYVQAERFIYFWDYAIYQNKTYALAHTLRISPMQVLQDVKESLGKEYNLIPALAPAPFLWLLGQNRTAFILGLSLCYQLPLALLIGGIASLMSRVFPKGAFWTGTLVTLLLPTVWAPTLRGYPDAGAAALIALAVLLYLRDLRTRHWWYVVVIGICLAGAMLFRRHFAYAAVAFFLAAGAHGLLLSCGWGNLRQGFSLTVHVTRLVLMGGVTAAVLLTIGRDFLRLSLTRNYMQLYSAYMEAPFSSVMWLARSYGWLLFGLALAGYALSMYRKTADQEVSLFVVLFGSCTFLLWGLVVRQTGWHYTLHIAAFIVLGLVMLLWSLITLLTGAWRIITLFAVATCMVANLCTGLTPWVRLDKTVLHPLFVGDMRPLVRTDFPEVARLVAYLRAATKSREPIYVAASSVVINSQILVLAEQTFHSQAPTLYVLQTPEVDSRDPNPLPKLLQAEFVLTTTPFAYHLKPEEQDIVRVVRDALEDGWEIAHDFERLPVRFALHDGTIVHVYRRLQPTSPQTARQTWARIQARYHDPWVKKGTAP